MSDSAGSTAPLPAAPIVESKTETAAAVTAPPPASDGSTAPASSAAAGTNGETAPPSQPPPLPTDVAAPVTGTGSAGAAGGGAGAGGVEQRGAMGRYRGLCPSIIKGEECWAKTSGKACFYAFHSIEAAKAAGIAIPDTPTDICRRCSKPGHMAKDCPNAAPAGGGGGGGGGRGGRRGGPGRREALEDLHPTHLYVAHLPSNLLKPDLEKMFSPFGTLTSVQVLMDKGKSRGVAFVHYERPEQAQAAIAKYHLFQIEPNSVV